MAKPIKKQTWSNIDVFGLLNGKATWDDQYKSLRYVRKPFESAIDLKNRILDSHDYPSDVTKQGLINGLSVEFGLTPYSVEDKTIFTLNNQPIPSGNIGEQDVFGYYKNPGDTSWSSMGPQVWADTYNVAKKNKQGFICWQNERHNNISGYKNYRYSTLVEVLQDGIEDKAQLKFEYYLYVSDYKNNRKLVKFTDMNNQEDPNDTRFTYRKGIENPSLSGNIVAYNLNDIPVSIKNQNYYDKSTGIAKSFLYDLKSHMDKKFKHTWNEITNKSSIWDVHLNYGSGHIPHFYDAEAPQNGDSCSLSYSGLTGGVEELSYSLYPESITESGSAQSWFLKLYPGRFYLNGIPYYYFENPKKEYLTFVDGEASIPSGLTRGMYTLMAKSGYYTSYCNRQRDEYLSNVYQDYNYRVGEDEDKVWGNIYRHRPNLNSIMGYTLNLDMGEYAINWESGVIKSSLPSGYEDAVLVWDEILVPSGTHLLYDINPLNDTNLSLERFFLYLSLD